MARRWRLSVTVMNQNDWINVMETIMKTSRYWLIDDAKRLLNKTITEKSTLCYDTDSWFECYRLVRALSKTRCSVNLTGFLWNDYQDEKAES